MIRNPELEAAFNHSFYAIRDAFYCNQQRDETHRNVNVCVSLGCVCLHPRAVRGADQRRCLCRIISQQATGVQKQGQPCIHLLLAWEQWVSN